RFFHGILFALGIRAPAVIKIAEMSDQLPERTDLRLRAWTHAVKFLGHLLRGARNEFPIHAVGIAKPGGEIFGGSLLASLRRQWKRHQESQKRAEENLHHKFAPKLVRAKSSEM